MCEMLDSNKCLALHSWKVLVSIADEQMNSNKEVQGLKVRNSGN